MAQFDGKERNSFDQHVYWYKTYPDQIVFMHREKRAVVSSHPVYKWNKAPAGHVSGGWWTNTGPYTAIDSAANWAAKELPIMDYLAFVTRWDPVTKAPEVAAYFLDTVPLDDWPL